MRKSKAANMFFLSCVNTELMVFSTVFFLRFSRRAISSLDRPSFRLMLNMVLFCGGRLAMVVSMRLSSSLAYISCSTEVDCGLFLPSGIDSFVRLFVCRMSRIQRYGTF